MNQLSLELTVEQDDLEQTYDALKVTIDGVPLLEHARRTELPFAEAEGAPHLAGAYGWTPANTDSLHRLRADVLSGARVRTYLLQCTCGEPGCWPLACTLQRQGDVITLDGFIQPHRDPNHTAEGWHYEAMGPFRFAVEDFDKQIENVVQALGQTPGHPTSGDFSQQRH